MNPFVEINNVTLSYAGNLNDPAVQELSISISEGEFCAVVGPSGCGKSTLMKLVTGLIFPQAAADATSIADWHAAIDATIAENNAVLNAVF